MALWFLIKLQAECERTSKSTAGREVLAFSISEANGVYLRSVSGVYGPLAMHMVNAPLPGSGLTSFWLPLEDDDTVNGGIYVEGLKLSTT